MNTKMTKIILIYGFLLLLNACASRGMAQDDLNGKWKLIGYSFSSDREFPIEKMTIDLTIENGNHVGGHSSCNLYSGNLSLGENGAIKIGPLTWTDRPCDELTASFESQFLDVLQNATVYSLNKGVLTLNQGKTKNFLRFGRATAPIAEQPPAVEEHQTFFVSNRLVKCNTIGSEKCLQIKTDKNSIWHVLREPVSGFDFKPGRFYKIEVLRERTPNEPNKPSFYRYKLERIIKSVRTEKELYK